LGREDDTDIEYGSQVENGTNVELGMQVDRFSSKLTSILIKISLELGRRSL
jgi:hypothetical protein